MAEQSTATATNRRVEIITRHITARPRDRGRTLAGHSFWRLGPEWLVVATDVTSFARAIYLTIDRRRPESGSCWCYGWGRAMGRAR